MLLTLNRVVFGSYIYLLNKNEDKFTERPQKHFISSSFEARQPILGPIATMMAKHRWGREVINRINIAFRYNIG